MSAVRKGADRVFWLFRTSGRSAHFWVGIAAGLILGVALSWLFWATDSATPAISLVRMTPGFGETVPIDAEISLEFSSDVVDQEQLGKPFSLNIIQTEPSLEGQYIWETPSLLRFVLDRPLAASTQYSGVVDLSLIPVSGGRLEQAVKPIEFNTERLSVVKAGLSDGSAAADSSYALVQLDLEFNHTVEASQLYRYATVTDAATGKPIEFSLTPDTDSATAFALTLHLPDGPDRPAAVALSIDPGLTCKGGSLGLAEGFRAEFALPVSSKEQELEVYWSFSMSDYPSRGSLCISIGFSDYVSSSSFLSAVQLDPDVSLTALQYGRELIVISDQFKPGEVYTVTLPAGLVSRSGLELKEDFSVTLIMPDLSPRIEFDDPGMYLPKYGLQAVAVNCVNISEIEVAIYQIYRNNLAPLFSYGGPLTYRFESDLDIAGRLIETRSFKTNAPSNEETVLHIDLSHLEESKGSGIYGVVVRDKYNRWRSDSRLINCSDLGVVFKASGEGLLAMVRSIETLEPVPGAVVSVLSSNNQEIATQVTDGDGIAHFKGLRTALSEFKPMLVTVDSGSDYSFLPLDLTRIDTVGFDVSGREVLTQGYEAFIYPDRDLFRPGDTVHIAGFVRGPGISLPQSFPAQLTVYDPRGSVFRELPTMVDDTGSFELTLDVPSHSMTGEYLASLTVADREIGRMRFMVEEFIPERMKVVVKLDADSYRLGSTAQVEVSAQSLLGSAISGREVEIAVALTPFEFKAPGFTGYSFTDSSREFGLQRETITSGILSDDGSWTHSHEFSDNITPPSACEAEFRATVMEIGGRTSLGFARAVYHPYNIYAGVKVTAAGQQATVGEPLFIDCAAVNPDGTSAPDSDLTVEVFRVQWNTIYSRGSDGRYTYDVERYEEKVFEKTVTTSDDATARLQYVPKMYGTYKVVVSDASTEQGHRAATELWVSGVGGDIWSPASPEEVVIETDSTRYTPGSTAKVQIQSPFAGKALVTVERERVFSYFVLDVPQGVSEIDIPIVSEYVPNVYVTVQVIRSPKGLSRYETARAFGTQSIFVETERDRLDVKITASEVIRPNEQANIEIAVTGPDGKPTDAPAVVTLAAVDEGICQITGFDAPSPYDFFYGRKRLSVSSYDIYRLLIAEPRPATTQLTTGGDIDESRSYAGERHLNPITARRVKPVSLWSGLVQTDEQGRATVTLDVPEFSGTLRLMAVAASGRAFGNASETVMVQDKIVLSPTLPRFASSGDVFEIPVSIRNAIGSDCSLAVEISATGPINIEGEKTRVVELRDGEEALLIFSATADDIPGVAAVTITASGLGATSSVRTELSVRPSTPHMTKVITGTVTAAAPVTLRSDTEFVGETASYSFTVGPFPTAQLGAALQYLISYPYGCLEQTVSGCFPLLYYRELAAQTDPRLSLTDVSNFVEKGIDKIESMQLSDGSFSYWPGTFSRSLWSSVYAAHFLVEARNAGYQVSERVYASMLSFLESLANRKATDAEGMECRVYALYVLSLAGKPSMGNLAYMKKSGIGNLTGFSKAQLAAALALAGDYDGAREVMPDKFDAVPYTPQTGETFRSPSRDDAVVLHALATVDPGNPAAYALAKRLIDAMDTDGTWGTTQNTAFALLALGKAASVYETSPYTGTVSAAGGPAAFEFDSHNESTLDLASLGLLTALESEGVTISIDGDGTAYYALTVSGVPSSTADIVESDSGIRVRREYLDREGNPVDVSGLEQNDVIIVHITVAPEAENLKNVIIVDMLPAGLEIENPRLGRDVHLDWTDPQTLTPDYMDICDDRMILFASFSDTGEYHFYYAARAVTVGSFTLPPIKAECMYDPAINSTSGAGKIVVKE